MTGIYKRLSRVSSLKHNLNFHEDSSHSKLFMRIVYMEIFGVTLFTVSITFIFIVSDWQWIYFILHLCICLKLPIHGFENAKLILCWLSALS